MSYVSVNVDVAIDDIVCELRETDRQELIDRLLEDRSTPFGLGDGDQSRARIIIDRAFNAAQKLPAVPTEIKDLFWLIHGRAMA